MSTERPLREPLPRSITEPQQRAATPKSSIWVEANAGSGKTRVLTDRVLRLMLDDVPPDQILCLTYTKAAAAEMRQRLSARLGEWALLDDEGLARTLEELVDAPPADATLRMARTLFARALETPGGLKIQTIHAFCESVLHRFPVEAGVPFDFAVLEDFERERLILAAREGVLAEGLRGAGPVAGAVETLFDLMSDAALTGAIDEALAEGRKLRPLLADRAGAKTRLRQLLRLRRGESLSEISAEIVGGYPFGAAEHAAILAACPPAAGGTRFEDKLAGLDQAGLDAESLLATYLTASGTVPKTFPKKDIGKALPQLALPLLEEAQRLERLAAQLKKLRLLARSEALLDIVWAIWQRYESDKRARSLLDFDDLVARLSALLNDPGQGPWVRYKLDGGITHILVDESQDTNPEQWRVIDALVAEFFEPGGIERPRSLFAVGDGKQSIYSFQGAAPEEFREAGRKYELRARVAERAFERVRLRTSFRTLAGVLAAVDRVFADEARCAAVLEDGPILHETARADPGGSVTLWPPTRQPDEEIDLSQWPLDPRDLQSAPRRVADRIAGTVAEWIRARRPLAARRRAVRAEDVLILVQSRSPLFHELIRALHRHGLPTPGADRLGVTQHIAVLDLLALGDVLLNPGDDLQLAALLRSPLFEIDEDALFAIADGRTGTLWDALAASPLPAAQQAAAALGRWRGRLDFERPYGFFARLLYAEGGLRRFHHRMGGEVDDVMAEFLALALAHEQSPQPSLQGFLAAMRTREVTIRRELGERGGGVRVMTVHGAKGLEAPIVILADAASKPEGRQIARAVHIVGTADGPLLVHAGARDDHVPETIGFREDEAERQQAEYWRKLYVAMTRAEDELYVTGTLTLKGKLEGSWYEAIDAALRPEAQAELDDDGNEVALGYPATRVPPHPVAGELAAAPARPAPLALAALPPPEEVPTISPSRAGGVEEADRLRLFAASAETVRDAEAARREGLALHALLQHLPRVPPDLRPEVAPRALAALLPEAPERHAALADKALSLLGRTDLAALFGPDSRAELPFIVTALRDGRPVDIAGRMDRVLVTEQSVLVVDFKSDADATMDARALKPAYRTQLGLYALAATQLFPGRAVRAGILWTGLELLLELDRAALAEAVRGFTIR